MQVRKAGWDRDLPVKGVLLAGVPGGGKTLIAKAAASVLGTTLLRLDFGKFYSKFVGETERQFNRALQTIDQIAPVVVLIDEMEKYGKIGEEILNQSCYILVMEKILQLLGKDDKFDYAKLYDISLSQNIPGTFPSDFRKLSEHKS